MILYTFSKILLEILCIISWYRVKDIKEAEGATVFRKGYG